MDLKMLPVYIIIILVLIVVPILLGRRVGRSPLEILFGEQANNLFFRKKKKEGEKARAVFFCANLEGKYEIII